MATWDLHSFNNRPVTSPSAGAAHTVWPSFAQCSRSFPGGSRLWAAWRAAPRSISRPHLFPVHVGSPPLPGFSCCSSAARIWFPPADGNHRSQYRMRGIKSWIWPRIASSHSLQLLLLRTCLSCQFVVGFWLGYIKLPKPRAHTLAVIRKHAFRMPAALSP